MTHWTTRDGQRIPIREMTDDHLRNTIAYLERNAEALHFQAGMSLGEGPSGDDAQAEFLAGIDEMVAMDPIDWVREEYAALYEEDARRKQEPK